MSLSVILGIAVLGIGATALVALSQGKRQYRRGLIVGDSMTASPIITGILRQMTGFPWDNVAVSGQNSSQILSQVQEHFFPGKHDVVLVSIGANDGARPLSYTQNNVDALSRIVRGAGADLVIFSEPPLRGYRGFRDRPDALTRSAEHRVWVLRGGSKARYVIDLHRVIGDYTGRIREEFDAGDGLHPNRAGRVAMAREVVRRIT